MRISDWSSDVCSSDLCKLGRLRIEALAQFGALDTRAKMTAGAHLAVEPAAYCYPLRRIKVFGRSDTASMPRDRTIAETFQQRIEIGRASGRERVCQYV